MGDNIMDLNCVFPDKNCIEVIYKYALMLDEKLDYDIYTRQQKYVNPCYP